MDDGKRPIPNLHSFRNANALAEALAERVATHLREAIEARGHASIAVSGGSTPVAFFKALSIQALDWKNVHVTLIDERWVSPSDERSNARLVAVNLLQNEASAAKFVPLYMDEHEPQASLSATTAILVQEVLPLDVAILGMGTDGHTASFFPGGDNLKYATAVDTLSIVATMQAEGAVETRITLTLPVIMKAGFAALHIEGGEKMQVLEKARGEGPADELPIRHVLRNMPGLQVYWTD